MLERLLGNSKGFRRVFRLLYWEAAFAITFETCLNTTYLSGLAGELKVPLSFVSLLAAVPWIGATGQVFVPWILHHRRKGAGPGAHGVSIKRYVLGAAALGRALWFVPLILAIFWGQSAYRFGSSFPIMKWFLITCLCSSASSILTSASSNGWMCWMKTLIPHRFQGRFFGTRQRFTTAAFVAASIVAAFLLNWAPHGYRLGAGVLCLFAIAAGGISIYLHSFVSDVPIPTQPTREGLFNATLKPLQDPSFVKLLGFGAAFNGVVQLTSSYFPYYFTKELHVPMSSVVLWNAIANLGSFAAAGYWGKRADRSGTLYEILWFTGHLVAFSPLLYFLLPGKSLLFWMAPVEYFVNGVAWSGFLLAQTKLLMRLSPPKEGASTFSLYTAFCGITGAFCALAGGKIAELAMPWGGFKVLWLVGGSCRLLMLWLLCKPLLPSRAYPKAVLQQA